MDETQRRQEAKQSLDQMGLIIRATQAQLRLERQPHQFLDGLVEQIETLKTELPNLTEEQLFQRMQALQKTGQAVGQKIRSDIEETLKDPNEPKNPKS